MSVFITTMASKPFTFGIIFVILILLFSSPILASSNTSSDASYETICNFTPYPSYCKSNLPRSQSGTNRDLCRFFVHKSLSFAHHFLSLVNSYLKRPHSTFSEPTIRALEDCHLLAELNLDSLSKTYNTINSTNNMDGFEADELQTLLSAVLTNQQTCLDGLQEVIKSTSTLKNRISNHLLNDTKLCSISLALFRHGNWVISNHTRRDHKNRNMLFSTTTKRKLLQTLSTGLEGVLVSQMVVVNPNGTGNFTTISDAVNAAPNNTASIGGNNTYFVIYVVSGVYEEYVSIDKNKQSVMLIGDGINQTVITGNRSVVDGWTTFNSATFAVVGKGFVAINMTFRNTAGAIKHQAVAVRNGADLSAFYNCSLEGYQDTLYAHSLRQFYRDCDIYGTVDFIFGNAAVVLQNCDIYPKLPLPNQFNAITAQGRKDPNQNTGTSIHNCTIRAAVDLASDNGMTKTYLGRPWKQYSRTVYMQSYMDSVIDPAGWREWSGDFAISTLYYAEFNNTGPGSNTSNRVTWPGYHLINETDAVNFTVLSFIVGDVWLPSTGVPFSSGLL